MYFSPRLMVYRTNMNNCSRSLFLADRVASIGYAKPFLRLGAGCNFSTRASPFKTWDGNASQLELMTKDECLCVTEEDTITCTNSKYNVHQFKAGSKGILHRAFSVFLFDSHNRLLLQQRAASKITFPDVWTNTCCSHPLAGQSPNELDLIADIDNGSVEGVKNAARRKLQQELGILPESVPLEKFKFLTRLHYCAADVQNNGMMTGWGEHEMDYILFIKADVKVDPNVEEIQDYRFVYEPELQEMMRPENKLRWSPWFKIIAENFLPQWWSNLDDVLNSSKYDDWKTIHRIL